MQPDPRCERADPEGACSLSNGQPVDGDEFENRALSGWQLRDRLV
jgi:hypothetical protein